MNPSPPPTFMFIFRESTSPDVSPESFQRWLDWVERMRAKGQYLSGDPLEPAPGSVLRGQENIVITDGPYAEAKEIIGGFMLIRAANLAEAVKIARDCPGLPDGGSVEVRQVMPLPA